MVVDKRDRERQALELAYRKLRDLQNKAGVKKELTLTLAAVEALVPDLTREAR
jgi:hypothetical protein